MNEIDRIRMEYRETFEVRHEKDGEKKRYRDRKVLRVECVKE